MRSSCNSSWASASWPSRNATCPSTYCFKSMRPLPQAASEPAALRPYRGDTVAVDIGDDGVRCGGGCLGAAFGMRGAHFGLIRAALLAQVVVAAAHLTIGESHQQPADDRQVLERQSALQ